MDEVSEIFKLVDMLYMNDMAFEIKYDPYEVGPEVVINTSKYYEIKNNSDMEIVLTKRKVIISISENAESIFCTLLRFIKFDK